MKGVRLEELKGQEWKRRNTKASDQVRYIWCTVPKSGQTKVFS